MPAWTPGRRRGRGDARFGKFGGDRRLGPGSGARPGRRACSTGLLNKPVWNVLSPFPIDPADADAADADAAEGDAAEGDAAEGDAAETEESADESASDGGAQSAEIVQAPDYSPEFQAEVDALDCLDPVNLAGGTPDDPTEWLGACDQSGGQKYVMEPAFIEGVSVTDANAQLTQQGIGWVVTLEFDSEGAGALAEASTELSALPECGSGATPCNAFAIVLDGVVVSAPRFNEPILGGQAQIEGDFNVEEARDLANVLKYGALPVTLDVVDITSVSATVGGDQLRAGIIAGLIGLALVSIYLLPTTGARAVAVMSLCGGRPALPVRCDLLQDHRTHPDPDRRRRRDRGRRHHRGLLHRVLRTHA